MHFVFRTLLAVSAISSAWAASTPKKYHLKTSLKPGQSDKARFDELWLYAYHTAAGFNAVTFSKSLTSSAAEVYLQPVPNTTSTEDNYLRADLEGSTEWGTGNNYISLDLVSNVADTHAIDMLDVNYYASWQPVQINAGQGNDGFFFNSTGLQYTSNPNGTYNEFGGWIGKWMRPGLCTQLPCTNRELVCDWWLSGVPQLFYRLSFAEGVAAPCSCADVHLMPVAI